MANERKQFKRYVNIPENKLIVSATDAGEDKRILELRRGNQYLLEFDLFDDADTPAAYAIPASSTWLGGVDNVFTSGHPDLALSGDSKFNLVADRADVDMTLGKICFRLDMTGGTLATTLGDDEFKTMYLVAWYTPPGEKPVQAFHLDVRVYNTAVENNPPGPDPDPATIYATLAQLASTANGDGASRIGIFDGMGNFASTNVEDALAELYNLSGGGLPKRGSVTSDNDQGEGIYKLDASSGAFNFTLPASSGSQKRYVFQPIATTTNAATIAVQSGENLNGIQNGTRVIDDDQQLFIATDFNMGEWVISNLTAAEFDTIGFDIEGNGSAIAVNSKGYQTIGFDCMLLQIWIVSKYNETGSVTLDFWKDVLANYPPVDADSITNSNEPAISSAKTLHDSDLSNWSTQILKRGDVLAVNVDANTTFTGLEVRFLVMKL